MKTQIREAFERLAKAQCHRAWVQKRLRHLLDRSTSGIIKSVHYDRTGTWRVR